MTDVDSLFPIFASSLYISLIYDSLPPLLSLGARGAAMLYHVWIILVYPRALGSHVAAHSAKCACGKAPNAFFFVSQLTAGRLFFEFRSLLMLADVM